MDAPLYIVGSIAAFLLMMVALGLTGVVWQSVTQRIREFGLRRAKGATIGNVRTQVLVEMVIMTSIALLAGVLLVAQLPLLPLPRDLSFVPGGVFVTSTACLGDGMSFIKYVEPLGRMLGLMPMVKVFTEAELARSITDAGFAIEHQWRPNADKRKAVFIVARKAIAGRAR